MTHVDLFEEIKSARERLRGQAHVTPIMTSRGLNALAGTEVFCKCENLQRGGAFKFRGAFNAVSKLDEARRKRGIITYSSGNHGQAIALVCQTLELKATIVMPHDSSPAKRAACQGYGAEIILCDQDGPTREEVCRQVQEKHGYTVIPPYDHLDVIAGQGTATLEIFDQLQSIDTIIAPCGGGGLLSGTAIAAKGLNPRCRVIGIEPESADDATRSFRTRRLHTVKNPPTIADGTRTPSLGRHTFPLVLEYVDDMATVSEDAIKEAVRWLFSRMKLVVEPSGALGIAALMSHSVQANGKTAVILSGGNVDAATMAAILQTGPV